MEFADYVKLADREPRLRFLVIGGYAVGAHGHTRGTFDVDFLAARSEQVAWDSRILGSGLAKFGATANFIQYTQLSEGEELDLMLVDDSTFEQFWSASEDRDFGGIHARVPCLDHLLALKLHALKQALAHRTSKDAQDVEMLVRRNKLNLNEVRYKELFLKYGNQEIYDTILRILRHP